MYDKNTCIYIYIYVYTYLVANTLWYSFSIYFFTKLRIAVFVSYSVLLIAINPGKSIKFKFSTGANIKYLFISDKDDDNYTTNNVQLPSIEIKPQFY